MDPQIEDLISKIEATGQFRVARRIDPGLSHLLPKQTVPGPYRNILFIDSETTGLDHDKDKAISVGYSLLRFNAQTGEFAGVVAQGEHYEDPGIPIPTAATAVHGITVADVAGKRFDDAAIEAMVSRCDMIAAHNAGFDRPMLEKRLPCLKGKPWVCTANDIDWQQVAATRKLEFLLYRNGYYHDAHGAMQDTCAQAYAIVLTKDKDGKPAALQLFEAAREAKVQIWALTSHFDSKDTLKKREYRWCDGSDGKPKAWHITVPEDKRDEEISFLNTIKHDTRSRAPTVQMDTLGPIDRFTSRVSHSVVVELTELCEEPRVRVRP